MVVEISLGVSDIMVRWIVLVALYLFLTYLFRDKVIVEGFFGFILPVGVLIPINVLAKEYVGFLELDIAENMMPGAYFTAILVFNTISLLIFNKIMPGLTVSSNIALVLFAASFTVISFFVGMYFPVMPEISLGL